MLNIYTRFQTKMAQKTLPDGAAHTRIAYTIREYPPGLNYLKLHRKDLKSHLGIKPGTSHTEDTNNQLCQSLLLKKGKRKVLCSRMLTWPNGNLHLQVDNMIIF